MNLVLALPRAGLVSLAVVAIALSASPGYALSSADIVGIAMPFDTGHVYVWYRDGTVSSGTSNDVSKYRRRYDYVMPKGYSPDDIVGIAAFPYLVLDKRTPLFDFKPVPATIAFYKDGKYSMGVSNNLAKYHGPRQYYLPDGKQPKNIVGVSYSKKHYSNNYKKGKYDKDMAFFAFYSDGTVSAGYNPDKFYTFRKPYQYVLPTGIKPQDIVGTGCAPDTRHHYAWYKNRTVSSGVSDHLDRYRKPYSYILP
ncbi:MAG: hypothetical protein WBD99_05765 [Thermodesulfobacteriota bacterium]